MSLLWQIYTSFFRVGLFTIGGGYAMLPMLEREIIRRRGWIDHERILDIYAAAQSLPGAIALNTATFIGQVTGGTPGAISASLGVVTPSIVIIIAVATILTRIEDVALAQYALRGMSAAVVALIIHSAAKLGIRSIRSWAGLALALLSLILMAVLDISAVLLIVGAIVVGAANALRAARLERSVKEGDTKC